MIFFVDSGGTIFKSIPEKVYQGSVNANTIYLVGAFPSNCSVALSYRLPNVNYTTPELMARVTESDLTDIQTAKGQGYNVWSAKINGVATENYGTVAVQFFVYATDGTGGSVRLATASSSFNVERGVPIVLPDKTDYYESLLTEILAVLSEVQASKDVAVETAQMANNNAITSLSNSSTALQTATNAESLAQNAVSTANSSLQQAKDYTDEQIANYGLYVILSELPETGLPNKIYLVPTTNATENNVYDEYLWVNGAWEFQGSGKVDFDLSDTKIKEIVAETYLVGETAPTTETVAQFVGQLYVDTTGNATYQCTAITEENGVKSYTWVKLIRSTDYAGYNEAGVVKTDGARGIVRAIDGRIQIQYADDSEIDGLLNVYRPIVPFNLRRAVKVGLTKNNITLTDEEQTSACEWLGAVKQTNSAKKVYGTDDKGIPFLHACTTAPVPSAIVQRNADASIQVPASTGSHHAVNNKRMISYVDNLPDNLTLTEDTYAESGAVAEGTKAKWQHWIGLGILVGKLEQEIGTVGHFYPIISDTWNFSEVPVIPKLGVVYYDVMGGRFLRWVGRTFIDTAFLLSEPANVSIANFPDNVASDNNVWESMAKEKWQEWLGLGDINTALETILGV